MEDIVIGRDIVYDEGSISINPNMDCGISIGGPIAPCPNCGRDRLAFDLIHLSTWEGCSKCFAAVFEEHATLKNSIKQLKAEVENLRSKIRY